MSWSASQQKRLGFEKEILESYFGDEITWTNQTKDTSVDLNMTTSSDNHYTLRIYLPSDYPNSCPELTVASPKTLRKKDGTEIYSATSEDHTYGTKNGLVKICHFRPYLWTNEYTLYQVYMKGFLWLEAYEAHKRTGKSISQYLREM